MIDNEIKFGNMDDGAPLRISTQKKPGPNSFHFFQRKREKEWIACFVWLGG